MGLDQEQRHVCRRCSKSFLSGRVLGGHMRCHMKQKTVEADLDVCTLKMIVKADGENGYALRENPTKSWKSKDDDANSAQENQCKICGKGFESMRALFGHMRHHSKKRKKGVSCKECGEKFRSLKALAAHIGCHSGEHKVCDKSEPTRYPKPFAESLSDCENLSSVVRRKRSQRTRYAIGQSSSLCPLNESSSLDKSEQEIEEVALSLMMLSRGVRAFEGTATATESSANNSMIFEVKSSRQTTKFVHNEAVSFVFNGSGSMKIEAIGTKKVSSVFGDSQIVSDESNSKLLLKSTEVDNTQLHCEQTGKEPVEFLLRKKAKLEACLAQPNENFSYKINATSDSCNIDVSQSKSELLCKTGNNLFFSPQALHGHQIIHRASELSERKTDDCKRSIQTENVKAIEKLELTESLNDHGVGGVTMTGEEPRAMKQHKCSVCLKVFATGQALGGHKRAHIAKNSQFSEEEAMLLEQEISETSDEFGFDIPAIPKEDTEGDLPIRSWWVGCEQKHEVMMVV